jgi:flagellar biosynthesis GTPase FlhF
MSTAAYDTAPRHPTPPHAAARDDSWLDSWEAGRDPGHPDPHGTVPGYFAPRIYRGRTVEELIPTIVAELGEDAVVLRHHRGLTGGFAGFFQKSFVEIEARRGDPGGSLLDRYDDSDATPALPGDPPPTLPREATPTLPDEFEDARAPVALPKPLNWDGPTEVWATNPFAAALAEAEAAVRAAEPAVPPDLDATLAEALAEAEDAEAPEEILAAPPPDLYAQPPELPAEAMLPAEPATTVPPTPLHPAAPDTLIEPEDTALLAREDIERTLRRVGIGDEFVHELIEAAVVHVLALMPASTSLAQAVHTALTQLIPACRPLPAGGAAIAVVGAGGSGKSACCVALAEAYCEHSTLPATCVTVRHDVAPDESALREARTGGLLLLDTPPVSCADPDSISALAELLEQLAPDRVVLALPATLGATPAAQLLQALRPLNATALAITHADETDQLGVAVQTACTFGLAPVHMLARAEHVHGDAHVHDDSVVGANAPRAPRAWALTWTDPFLLADRLLAPR